MSFPHSLATMALTVLLILMCISQGALSLPQTRDEVVADFEQWVKRVGEKHAAAHVMTSSEFGASKAGESRVIVVDQSGAGNFKTVNDALKSIDVHNKAPITIKVNAGTYV